MFTIVVSKPYCDDIPVKNRTIVIDVPKLRFYVNDVTDTELPLAISALQVKGYKIEQVENQ